MITQLQRYFKHSMSDYTVSWHRRLRCGNPSQRYTHTNTLKLRSVHSVASYILDCLIKSSPHQGYVLFRSPWCLEAGQVGQRMSWICSPQHYPAGYSVTARQRRLTKRPSSLHTFQFSIAVKSGWPLLIASEKLPSSGKNSMWGVERSSYNTEREVTGPGANQKQ
jgi:hypothetical protein